MPSKTRGRKKGWQTTIQPRLNRGEITARRAFTTWNSGFGNDRVKDYNESLWRYKIGRRKNPPDHTDMGVRKEQADASEEVIDAIISRR